MSLEAQLREKLRKIEALFAGVGTAGERLAAEAALGRVRARLAELQAKDPPIEMQFSMPDQWSRQLFLALSRRYGLRPYRYPRQRRTMVMLRVPQGFIDQVLWPKFQELTRRCAIIVRVRVTGPHIHGTATGGLRMSDYWFTSCTVTCPACGHRQREEMPGQLWSLACGGCGTVMHPPADGCCVFCAYGDVPCPDAQISASCSCGSEGA